MTVYSQPNQSKTIKIFTEFNYFEIANFLRVWLLSLYLAVVNAIFQLGH
jgi:hypothetical protein